ncbi:poly-gamma-glutamate synthesis protein (capsule biosynthesis protein) [Sphingobium fontiphilum]|uniref:Poly-gamma-glutamate synthesis protein (Capsule biosynthesis protein) n=1 Tax=Sphingobium fontiphilum TaxID=944425 RepID=A0A7W6GPQ7_9SPHN|nr:CapA family protein [Sphingobium fontiphilum]MBB3982802.1 poly-gamma-glutamate synthesis protein (capsule biosynthesis protein) [Sphingobium fontiphilum]
MPDKTLRLFAVGDLQLMTREPPADLFTAVTPVLSAADVTFGNCEWPYAEEAGDTHPVEAHINDDFDGGDLFAPGAPESIAMMATAGFDVMSVANNHTMHGGYRAFLRTIALLRESGIAPVGGGDTIVTAREPAIVERKGHRIGFLACTSGFLPGAHAGRRTPGIVPLRRHTYAENNSWHDWGIEPDTRTLVNRDDLAAMIECITRLKAEVDTVVLSCHWGILEHESAIADYQRDAARAFIDAGVDLIVSQGPLPIKGFEVYRGKAILYCMGKFAMISPWSRDETPSGISAPLLDETSRGLGAAITIADGAITGVQIVPVYLGSSGRPNILQPGDPHYDAILGVVAERTAAAGLNGTMDAQGRIKLD